MPRISTATAAALLLALALACPGSAAERFADAVGDAVGDARDIVVVTVSEPMGPVLRFDVELGSEPPLRADEAGADLLWLAMDIGPEVAFPELDGYGLIALGSTLADDLEAGGHLIVGTDGDGTETWWHVVDIALDGATVSFSLDRKLLGDPDELYFRVYSGYLQGSLYTEQVDHYPAEDEPPARYLLSAELD